MQIFSKMFHLWLSFWAFVLTGLAFLAIPAILFKIFDPGNMPHHKKERPGAMSAACYSMDVDARR